MSTQYARCVLSHPVTCATGAHRELPSAAICDQRSMWPSKAHCTAAPGCLAADGLPAALPVAQGAHVLLLLTCLLQRDTDLIGCDMCKGKGFVPCLSQPLHGRLPSSTRRDDTHKVAGCMPTFELFLSALQTLVKHSSKACLLVWPSC